MPDGEQCINAYGETSTLKPGLTLEADALQERRKAWEWALASVGGMAANQNFKH